MNMVPPRRTYIDFPKTQKGSRLLYQTRYRKGTPYRVFFSYHLVLVEDPGKASWLTVREAKQIRDEQRRFHGRVWYVLGKEETLVYTVMNT